MPNLRFVGLNSKNTPSSWSFMNMEAKERTEFLQRRENFREKIFAYGLMAVVPRVSSADDLLDAMNVISGSSASVDFQVLDWSGFVEWRDGPVTSKDKPLRKSFEVDFEQITNDGKLLIREPVDPKIAWEATLAACGVIQTSRSVG